MKYLSLLPLAALAGALVIPDEQVLGDLSVEANHRAAYIQEETWTKDEILDGFKSHFGQVKDTVSDASKQVKDTVTDTSSHVQAQAKSALDEAFGYAHEAGAGMTGTAFDAKAWIENNVDHAYDAFEHHGPPKEEPPHHGPGKKPHHPPQHGKPNQTVYQLISESKYTTKLAKLINDYPDLVEALNGTKANYTVFAPTDSAFEKIPEHAPKPSKEQLKALLTYHVSPEFFPAGRVLVTHTIPTLLKGEHLSDEPKPQRLSVNIGLRGLTLNFYSRVVAINIFGTNGVIHGVDSLLLPPPNVIKIIDLLPSEFSTLELGLGKTGLLEEFNTTHHPGGTFFAPSNFAFVKLGPRINAFLFSDYGRKYLKALLQYHVVPKTTLYSDAVYEAGSDSDSSSIVSHRKRPSIASSETSNPHFGWGKAAKKCHKEAEHQANDDSVAITDGHKVPKGYYHYDLPTLLEDRTLNVDIGRYGGFISIKVNGFARVTVEDGIAEDGVIQVVSDVLIPPKKMPGASRANKGVFGKVGKWVQDKWDDVKQDGEMSVEEFVSRFDGLVEGDGAEAVEAYKIDM